jgi:hypothetical protein
MVVTTKRGGRRRETMRVSLLLKLGRRWCFQEREGRVFRLESRRLNAKVQFILRLKIIGGDDI